MTHRNVRAHRALKDAIPIAKARGLIQLAMGGPERIYDISIVSKIPVVFATIMFAPKILAPLTELIEYYESDLARLRVIARDAAVVLELWIRSRHGTWRFFQVTPSTIVEIDREGKRLESGQTIDYLAGVAAREQGGSRAGHIPLRRNTCFLPLLTGEEIRARIGLGCTSFASPPFSGEAMIRKNAVIGPELIVILRREIVR